MKVLVDSCILIDFLAGHEPARVFLDGLDGPAISLITLMEVLVGASGPEEEVVVRAFLSSFAVLPIGLDVALEAVALRRARRIKLPDAIILATARVHGRSLATRNTRDFPAEPGVLVPYSL